MDKFIQELNYDFIGNEDNDDRFGPSLSFFWRLQDLQNLPIGANLKRLPLHKFTG